MTLAHKNKKIVTTKKKVIKKKQAVENDWDATTEDGEKHNDLVVETTIVNHNTKKQKTQKEIIGHQKMKQDLENDGDMDDEEMLEKYVATNVLISPTEAFGERKLIDRIGSQLNDILKSVRFAQKEKEKKKIGRNIVVAGFAGAVLLAVIMGILASFSMSSDSVKMIQKEKALLDSAQKLELEKDEILFEGADGEYQKKKMTVLTKKVKAKRGEPKGEPKILPQVDESVAVAKRKMEFEYLASLVRKVEVEFNDGPKGSGRPKACKTLLVHATSYQDNIINDPANLERKLLAPLALQSICVAKIAKKDNKDVVPLLIEYRKSHGTFMEVMGKLQAQIRGPVELQKKVEFLQECAVSSFLHTQMQMKKAFRDDFKELQVEKPKPIDWGKRRKAIEELQRNSKGVDGCILDAINVYTSKDK